MWSAPIDARRLCCCFRYGDQDLLASCGVLALPGVAGDQESAFQPRNGAFALSGARIPTSSSPTMVLLVLAPTGRRVGGIPGF